MCERERAAVLTCYNPKAEIFDSNLEFVLYSLISKPCQCLKRERERENIFSVCDSHSDTKFIWYFDLAESIS